VGRDQPTKKAAPALRGFTLKVNSTPNSQKGQALQMIFLKNQADVTKVTRQMLSNATHTLS